MMVVSSKAARVAMAGSKNVLTTAVRAVRPSTRPRPTKSWMEKSELSPKIGPTAGVEATGAAIEHGSEQSHGAAGTKTQCTSISGRAQPKRLTSLLMAAGVE